MTKRLLLVVMVGLLCSPGAGAADRVLTVFAAASLTDVLQPIGSAFTARTGQAVRFSFAASSVLARQIESGAPADVFISADHDWMDYLQERRLIRADTRSDVAGNALVLIAPADSRLALKVAPGFALAAALGPTGRLAMADPAAVPAGRYARQALTQLGVWSSVQQRSVAADNVRTALNFVARGEAPLGIVYATDARSESRVRVVALFPAGSHDPIVYPAAALTSAGPQAAAFVQFLSDPAARAAFTAGGFLLP